MVREGFRTRLVNPALARVAGHRSRRSLVSPVLWLGGIVPGSGQSSGYYDYFRPIDDRERMPSRTASRLHLVVLDACRWHKLSAYGFKKETAPGIEALARDPDAALFRRHYANATLDQAVDDEACSPAFAHDHGMFKSWRGKQDGRTVYRFSNRVLSDEKRDDGGDVRRGGYYTFATTTTGPFLFERLVRSGIR